MSRGVVWEQVWWVSKLVHDYAGYITKTQGKVVREPVCSRSSWVAPCEGWVKVNSDAAMLDANTVGVGAVIRDAQGKVLCAAVHRYQARWSVALAEAMAAKFSLFVARSTGCTHVELECDAYNLSKAIQQQNVGRSPLDLVVEDIVCYRSLFVDFSVAHVKRGGNTVAHLIARLNPSNGVEQFFVDDVPQGILTLAELDVS